MFTLLKPEDLRTKLRAAIQKKFADLKEQVSASPDSLGDVAKKIGVTRQALSLYAKGSVPQADVLLAALYYWDWVISLESEPERPRWRAISGVLEDARREAELAPVQLSLFGDAKGPDSSE